MSNLHVVEMVCDLLDTLLPHSSKHYRELIEFVSDRPGHDFRYAVDSRKITNDLGWRPQQDFDGGLRKTISWYLQNESWLRVVFGR